MCIDADPEHLKDYYCLVDKVFMDLRFDHSIDTLIQNHHSEMISLVLEGTLLPFIKINDGMTVLESV